MRKSKSSNKAPVSFEPSHRLEVGKFSIDTAKISIGDYMCALEIGLAAMIRCNQLEPRKISWDKGSARKEAQS